MSNMSYLFVAFLVTWIVISGYLWMLGRQVQNLKDEVDALTEGTDLASDRFGVTARSEVEGRAITQR